MTSLKINYQLLTAVLIAAGLGACKAEPYYTHISIDYFDTEVPPEWGYVVGVIADLERANGDFYIVDGEDRIELVIGSDGCLLPAVGNEIMVWFVPKESYDDQQRRINEFIMAAYSTDGDDDQSTFCAGSAEHPAWR